MSTVPYKPGAWIDCEVGGKTVEGEILTICGDIKNKGRFRATIRDAAGNIHCVWIVMTGTGLAASGWQVDLAEAEAIARRQLAGERVNAPIEQVVSILSAAVLQLRGAA